VSAAGQGPERPAGEAKFDFVQNFLTEIRGRRILVGKSRRRGTDEPHIPCYPMVFTAELRTSS
jgi:hypothetical protein